MYNPVGESGCGKTTVARLILKLLDTDEGNIIFNGEDLVLLSETERKPMRQEIQIIFQDPYGSLNPRMTVGQSIAEGLRVADIHPGPDHKPFKRLAGRTGFELPVYFTRSERGGISVQRCCRHVPGFYRGVCTGG
jgi:ABC-type glutathione transport system ATPase component